MVLNVVGSHHTKNLDLELRVGSTVYTRTAVETYKKNTGRGSQRRHSDGQIRFGISNHEHKKIYQIFSKDKEEEVGEIK